MHGRLASLVTAAVLMSATVVAAQTPPPAGADQTAQAPQPPAAGRGMRGQAPGQGAPVGPVVALNEVEDMLDGAVLVRAQRDLQLSNDQYQQFLPKMRELQQARRDHQRRRTRLIMQLNMATRPNAGVDEATLTTRVKELDDLETQMFTEEATHLKAVDAILTPFQRARFRVFEENIEREKLRLIAQVMGAPGRGPAPDLPKTKKTGKRP
jgi:hypothetical protein